MRFAYPAYFSKAENDTFLVNIPDFGTVTEGYGLADAIYMARDAIGMLGIYFEDNGQAIPAPGSKGYTPEKEEILNYVDIDFSEYRTYFMSIREKKD